MAESKYNKAYYEKNKEKQKEMNAAYAQKNADHVRYLRSRSAARSFIRTKATLDDLEELQQLINERRAALK